MTRLRAAWRFALALMAPAVPLMAQTMDPGRIAPLPPSNDPSDKLAANLLVLSQNPNDVRALTEAGLSAIAVGDGNAALAFLARAETLSPNNGRIKAGLGSALLLLEKPTDALKLFGEASALGVPDADLARERGLAYDLRGDSRRAQRDYLLALRQNADDETTRRYALSLGISGDRDKALDVLDPLLRRQDRAAWRARVFILAMTGDLSEAESVAQQFMPTAVASSLSPFLRRLAKLNAAEQALAVNLGIMPGDGTQYASVQTGDPYRPSGPSDTLIPAGEPLGVLKADTSRPRLEPDSRDPRRRPGTTLANSSPKTETAAATPKPADVPARVGVANSTRVGARLGPVDPARVDAAMRPFLTTPPTEKSNLPKPGFSDSGKPVSVVRVEARDLPPPVYEVPAPSTPKPTPAAQQVPAFVGPPAAQVSSPVPLPPPSAAFVAAAPTPATVAPAASVPPVTAPAPAISLAAIIAGIEPETESAAGPLPDAAALRAARAALQKKAAAAAKAEAEAKVEKDKKAAEQLAAKKSPARIWVQVATGANDAGLPLTWKRLRDKAPDALKGLSASSAPYKATNRLLVGPFKSAAEAKKIVNGLSKSGVSAFTFSSEAGQEIAKVAGK